MARAKGKLNAVRIQPLIAQETFEALSDIAKVSGLPSANSVAASHLNQMTNDPAFQEKVAIARKTLSTLRDADKVFAGDDRDELDEIKRLVKRLLLADDLTTEQYSDLRYWTQR